MANILFKNVFKSFENKDILKDLSFEVNSGECFTIVGPSGCGKTVVLRLIAGFEVPDKGTITISDNIVASSNPKIFVQPENRKAGVVFQDYAVWPHKTVMGNVIYPLEIQKVEKNEAKRRAQKSIDMVNLSGLEDRLPYQLSGGQQQRVALSRALVADNNVLLLDEPLTNLDANLREEMRFEIKDIQRKTNNTIIYVTHDQEVALAISDRIAVMDSKGSFRQIGTPLEVYKNPIDPFVFKFLGLANFIHLKVKDGKVVIFENDKDFPYELNKDIKGKDKFLAAIRPMDVDVSKTKTEKSIEGTIERTSLLGAIIDYKINIYDNISVRSQIQTEEAHQNGYIFGEGESCFITFNDIIFYENDDEIDKEIF